MPPQEIVRTACRANGWFIPADIRRAAGAIAGQMLGAEPLSRWAAGYPKPRARRNVVVVMAGNIPFAGFFDLLCVVVSGHRCLVKYSSKDRVLMEFLTEKIGRSLPGIGIEEYDGQPVDAVIASGSDNAIRHIRWSFGGLPGIYRGNRSSAAVLIGGETAAEREGLADDIFSYNGLGCRNVSHLLLPAGYDITDLGGLSSGRNFNPKYLNNYRQRRALLTVTGEAFQDMGGWLARGDEAFPAALSEVTYHYYVTAQEAARWVEGHANELQCVVAGKDFREILPDVTVAFGRAQAPALTDYPDRVDIMKFLSAL